MSQTETDTGPYPFSERLFLALAGVFLAAMVCMNVLGITRFIEVEVASITLFGERVTLFQLAIGVLPYPATFLATDIICELYGKRRASYLVWCGFGLNIFLLFFCWLGGALPSAPFDAHPDFYDAAWTQMGGVGARGTPSPGLFYGQIWTLMAGATAASMVAYLVAQLCDVHLFHFWKRLTKGKHLWLRNNGSTLVSQLIDTVAVLGITFGAEVYAGRKSAVWLLALILGSYAFKLLAALLDTPLFYLAVHFLKPHVRPDPLEPDPLAADLSSPPAPA